MSARPGNLTALKVSGTAVPVTAEACGFVSGTDPNKVYQVSNTARRIWDPSAAITVKDGGVAVAAGLFKFNYLFGKVLFNGHSVTGAITVDGSYLPTVTVAGARKIDFSRTKDLADATVFGNTARARLPLLKDLSGSLSGIYPETDDLDPGTGGEQSLESFFTNDTPKLLECSFGGSTKLFRAWILLEKLDNTSSFDALVEHTYDFKGSNGGPNSPQDQVTTGTLSGWGS